MGPGPAGQDGLGPGGKSVAGGGYGNMTGVFATKREIEAASLSDGGVAAASGAAAEAKRRKTGAGSRGVANLTPEQLAKKRANDREAQRAIRERTKNQIDTLERRIEELTNLKPYQELQAVMRSKEAVELENADIKRHLVSVVNMIKPLIGLNAAEQTCTSPAQPYTSIASQMSNSLNYHVATPTSSTSLDQHHAHQPPPQQSWPPQLQPNTSGIDDNMRAQLEQQRHGLRHGLELGHERLDLDFLLAPGQRVPRLQRGVNGAQDTPQWRHVPMKHDWTLVGNDQTVQGRSNNAWESPGPMSVPVSIPSHHGHDSEASSPGYARRDTPSHHYHGHGHGPSPSPGLGGGGIPLMAADPDAHVDPDSPARYAIPVRNSSPTCPLDHLLLDFAIERRQRAGEGLSPHEVAGPRYPSVSSLLNPANGVYSHPLSKFFTDILAKFPDISRLPEKVAVLYIMFLLMRWQIWPTRENYERLPEWIVPLPCQLIEPHAAWIDHLPFPRMRDKLIRHSPMTEHLFDNFFVPFTTTLCLSWPYEETDTLLQNPDTDELMINPVFERHLRNLNNWKLGKEFADTFPSLADTCNY